MEKLMPFIGMEKNVFYIKLNLEHVMVKLKI